MAKGHNAQMFEGLFSLANKASVVELARYKGEVPQGRVRSTNLWNQSLTLF